MLADYRHFIFSSKPGAEPSVGNEWLVNWDTAYKKENGYGWLD